MYPRPNAIPVTPFQMEVIDKVAYVMAEPGCVDAMVDMYKEYPDGFDMTVEDFKEMVKDEIFQELCANVFEEFVPGDGGDFFNCGAVCELFDARMKVVFEKQFSKFIHRVIH